MRMPGFTADLSAGRTRGHYRVTRGRSNGVRAVVSPQLGGRTFGGGFGGRFGTLEDYWVCADGCSRAHSACLQTCEGTIDNPQGSSHCLICDDNYQSCLAGCSRDIA